MRKDLYRDIRWNRRDGQQRKSLSFIFVTPRDFFNAIKKERKIPLLISLDKSRSIGLSNDEEASVKELNIKFALKTITEPLFVDSDRVINRRWTTFRFSYSHSDFLTHSSRCVFSFLQLALLFTSISPTINFDDTREGSKSRRLVRWPGVPSREPTSFPSRDGASNASVLPRNVISAVLPINPPFFSNNIGVGIHSVYCRPS